MRRRNGRNFWFQKQTITAAAIVVATAAIMTGIYVADKRQEVPEEKTAYVEETETEESAPASAVIEPEPSEEAAPEITEPAPEEPATAEVAQEPESQAEETKTVETGAKAKSGQSAINLHFSEDSELLWPLNGSVIMSYSMDQTVYFATLQQYKYNPAIIISGAVNDSVLCAAEGVIKEVQENEETGCTVTMDIGDGYTATYGQLAEVPYKAGAYVEMGQTLGCVANPTKYYSVEGSNLYFKLEKDGVPVDPVLYFE